MFVYDAWYVAAFSKEVTQVPLARKILNRPVVLFRKSGGEVIALEDRCCHKGLPLSMGEVIDDNIRCNYHGMTFSSEGMCVRVPGQRTIPEAAKVRSYPVVERGLAVWIWVGRTEAADEALIPPFPWFDDPAWAWKHGVFDFKCNFELLHDNLLDLSHIAYVHRYTIGGDPETHFNTETKVRRNERGLSLSRWMLDSNPPPTYSKLVAFSGNVDRWQEVDFCPGLISLYSGAIDAKPAGLDGNPREGGFQLRLFDAVTPETESTTLNFFAAGHNFSVDDPHVTEALFEELRKTVEEDVEVLNAQQARLDETSAHGLVDIRLDVAGLQARRLLSSMRELEVSRKTGFWNAGEVIPETL